VPGSVEYLLVEVQTVHADLVLLPLSARTHLQDNHLSINQLQHQSINQLQNQPLINQSAAASTIYPSISCSINHLSIKQLQHQNN
jgi:predicted transposase YdaD